MNINASVNPMPLLVSMGEPGGIGPELVLKVWAERNANSVAPFILVADRKFMERRAARLGLAVKFGAVEATNLPNALQHFAEALPVLDLAMDVSDEPGIADARNGAAVIAAIEKSVTLMRDGKAGALITNPIQKSSLYEAGFQHPGHTEFLGELGTAWTGAPCQPVMMLAGPELRTVPATVHIPLKDVPDVLNGDDLLNIITITERELREKFAIAEPRIVVAGLNPHAGENNTMGFEDSAIIAPAIETARAGGLNVTGPHPADTLFHAAKRKTYDAAIAMYHDQALLPVKTIAFDETVNVTLGLPFIRTSPDHGTALDIAGKGIARPDSLLAAIKMADEMAAASASKALTS